MQVTDWTTEWPDCAKKTGGLRLRLSDSWTRRRGRGFVADENTARGCFFSGEVGVVLLLFALRGRLSGLTGRMRCRRSGPGYGKSGRVRGVEYAEGRGDMWCTLSRDRLLGKRGKAQR